VEILAERDWGRRRCRFYPQALRVDEDPEGVERASEALQVSLDMVSLRVMHPFFGHVTSITIVLATVLVAVTATIILDGY
jgi:hypothetical protein